MDANVMLRTREMELLIQQGEDEISEFMERCRVFGWHDISAKLEPDFSVSESDYCDPREEEFEDWFAAFDKCGPSDPLELM